MCFYCMIIAALSLMFSSGVTCAQTGSEPTNNEIFIKMVGPEVIMDSNITAKVLQSKPKIKFTIDSDNDGRIDTIYIIDNDERHLERFTPLLVKIVDEDGDMYLTGEGDLDSDLYVADWYGDGTIDRVIDYIDLDGDGDVDEQVIYIWSKSPPPPKTSEYFLTRPPKIYNGKMYCAAWGKDYGDDNRLWYDCSYEHSQDITQWLDDFNGDEMFVYKFFFDYERNTLSPGWENPFAFYDLDGDSYSEEVVRFTGAGPRANNLRYSMDIDNDTRGTNHLDYDFSISAHGPINYPIEKCETVNLRGIETEPFLKWEHVRQVAKEANWNSSHLTWVENDNNVDPRPGRKHNERWEGVLSHGNEYIRRIGGPSCGPYNNRNEVDKDNSGHFRFYYSPVDRRLHLFGAEVGWIKADYNYDDKVDMVIWMDDEDQDGFFDTWKYDVDADGTFDRRFKLQNDEAFLYPFDYKTLHEVYMPSLQKAVADNQKILDVLKAVLKKYEKKFTLDPIEEYFRSSLIDYSKEFNSGQKIKNSPMGTRYYGDLIRERYWHRLEMTAVAKSPFFPDVKRAYETGDFLHAADLLERHVLKDTVSNWFGSYQKRFTIELSNPAQRYLEHHPFILKMSDIQNAAVDFNPRNYVLVESEPRIDWRPVPSQVDDTNGDKKSDELVFVHSLLPSSTTRLYCYYSPKGSSRISYPAKTDAHDERKVGIGWESNWCAYRMYYGQIDFFGKRLEGLRLKTMKDYHHIADWGMDVLHVGESSGLGGISIWEGDKRIPVMNPAGGGAVKIKQQILSTGPVRALVRLDFTNIRSAENEYKVSLLVSTFADNRFSRQDITITSTAGDSVVYSPGIVKLANDTWYINTAAGMLASWGCWNPEIKDIGLGLMFSPDEYCGYAESDNDRYVKLKIPAGLRRTHWILGGWRKGFKSPVAPTGRNWAQRVEQLGHQLRTPVQVRYHSQ